MRSGEKWCLKRPLAPFLSKATEAREGIDLLSIPTVSTTAESTYHWNSRIHDRIELCNKKMYGTYSSRMFYDIATYKIVLMFRGYGMTFFVAISPSYKRKLRVWDSSSLFYREFPPSSQESVRAVVSWHYKLLLARRSPPIKFASLSHVINPAMWLVYLF